MPYILESYTSNCNTKCWLNKYYTCHVNMYIAPISLFLHIFCCFVIFSCWCIHKTRNTQDHSHHKLRTFQEYTVVGKLISQWVFEDLKSFRFSLRQHRHGFSHLSSAAQLCFGSYDHHQPQALGCIVFQEVYLSPGSQNLRMWSYSELSSFKWR